MNAAVSASADEFVSLPRRPEEASGAQVRNPLSDPSRHRLTPGTRVGDHLVVRGVLGEGGTAVVYEALHTRLGASVALKVVDVADEFMEGARARLLREAHVCATIEDAHIPRIYDVGELPDGTPYVVMERVSGRTLENVLLQGALPLDIAVQITEDLLLAVEACERACIVHRDIKPPNVILQSGAEGTLRVRLMDFGVSKNVSAEREPTIKVNKDANPSLTQQGAIVGTPHYMAPEQIVGPNVDTRADLYAVGVVAYEMMSGRTAFEGETTGDVVAAVLHTRPLPLSRLREVHPELEAWVERAMAPRRSERFRNAREMREALRDAWDEHQSFAAAAGQRTWTRRARWVGLAAMVGLGLALPKPAGYDFASLTHLLGFSSEQAKAATPVADVQANTANASTLPIPAAATGATAKVAHPSEPKMDLVGKTAHVEEPVGNPTAPLSPPLEERAPVAAPVKAEPAPVAVAPTPVAPASVAPASVAPAPVAPASIAKVAAPVPAAKPEPVRAVAPTAPKTALATSLAAKRPAPATPAARKRPFLNPEAPVGPSEVPQSSRGTITAEQRGMLMGDYVQQLDRHLNAPMPPVERTKPPEAIPDNPYGE